MEFALTLCYDGPMTDTIIHTAFHASQIVLQVYAALMFVLCYRRVMSIVKEKRVFPPFIDGFRGTYFRWSAWTGVASILVSSVHAVFGYIPRIHDYVTLGASLLMALSLTFAYVIIESYHEVYMGEKGDGS